MEIMRMQRRNEAFRTPGALGVALVLDPSDLASAVVPESLGADYELKLHAGSPDTLQPSDEMVRGARILVVQVPSGDAAAISEFERLARKSFAHVPVIAAVRGLTLTDTRTLMRLGATDVVPLPFAADELSSALDNARAALVELADRQVRQGKLISFLKSVGGVGATTIATQTGCMLAAEHRDQQVCLIDLDLQFGSAATHLDVAAPLSLGDIIAAGSRLDGALLRSVAVQHASGLHVIAAPVDIMPLDALGVDTLTEMLAIARQEFDLIIVDLPAAWTDWSLSALAHSDLACLVTEPSVPAIRQARRAVDLLETQALGTVPLHIIVNRVERSWLKTISMEETERALRRRVDSMIANDFRTVSAAVDQGKVLGEIKPKSRVERDVSDMARQLLARLSEK